MPASRAAKPAKAIRHKERPDAASLTENKENQPPGKSKKTVSTRGIYKQGETIKRKGLQEIKSRDVLSPKFAGITKAAPKKPGFFARFAAVKISLEPVAQPDYFQKRDKKEGLHPPTELGFDDVTKKYCEDFNSAHREQVQWHRQVLEKRRRGLDETGRPLNRPRVPTEEDIEALRKQIEKLNKPVREAILDDPITLLNKGNGFGNTKYVRLGDTLNNFDQNAARIRKDIANIERALLAIDEEVAELKREVQGPTKESREAEKDRDRQIAKLQKEEERVEKEAKAEIKGHKEEYDAKIIKFNRQLQDLCELAGDD